MAKGKGLLSVATNLICSSVDSSEELQSDNICPHYFERTCLSVCTAYLKFLIGRKALSLLGCLDLFNLHKRHLRRFVFKSPFSLLLMSMLPSDLFKLSRLMDVSLHSFRFAKSDSSDIIVDIRFGTPDATKALVVA